MGISYSSLNSFTPTPSYLAAADGSPMSMTLHPPQQKLISLSSRNDIPPSKSSRFRRCRRKWAHLICGITTLSPQTGAANLPRLRPQDPHREETARTPSPFRGVVPTSLSPPQLPSAFNPHPYQSRGRGSSGHTRSRSVGAQAYQRSPPPSPHRITRVASTSSLDGRRPPRRNVEPVTSQDDLRPTPWTNQIQVSPNSSDDRQNLESTLQSILPEDFRYSIGHCPIVITNTSAHRFSILVLGEVCDNCLTSLR